MLQASGSEANFHQRHQHSLKTFDKISTDQIRFQVTQVLSKTEIPKTNISRTEKKAVTRLQQETSIHILTADKGNVTAIIDREEYDSKIQHLINTETYKKLPRDPTPVMEWRFKSKLLSFHWAHVLPKSLHFKLRTSSSTWPVLYWQSKINKPDAPFWPINSTWSSLTYNPEKHRAKMLQPLLRKTQHHVRNSERFIQHIKELDILSSDTLISFNIESLFNSIPVPEASTSIKNRLQEDSTLQEHTGVSPDQIYDLLLMCLNFTSFKWCDSFYQQREGAAVGSQLSHTVANLFSWKILSAQTSSQHHFNRRKEVEQQQSIYFLDIFITKCPNDKPSHKVIQEANSHALRPQLPLF